MKKMTASETVATAALLGNLNCNVIKRMVTFIVSKTTDNNIINSLLTGIVIGAKINNKEKLAKLIGNYRNETIVEIGSLDIDVAYQQVIITFTCKRFAKTSTETKAYNTNKEQNDTYSNEVIVQNNCNIEVNDFDFEDSIEFEVI